MPKPPSDMDSVPSPARSDPDFLAEGGEMSGLIRAMDWSGTPPGPLETWSPALRMVAGLMLANRFPMVLWWGPEFRQIYNDAFRSILGDKHPRALGQPAGDCWPEIWRLLGPGIETPFRGGPATWMEDTCLEIDRRGCVEEAYFTLACSPVPDASVPGGIGGVLATVQETTGKVLGERRATLLCGLGARSAGASTAEQACADAAETLVMHPEDLPFALLYLADPDQRRVRLAGAAGMAKGGPASPAAIRLEDGEADRPPWPARAMMRGDAPWMLMDLADRLGDWVPAGPWTDPPRSAVAMPIRSDRSQAPAGFLVAGISARLPWDEPYREFLDRVAAQIAAAIAGARVFEEERQRAEASLNTERAILAAIFDHIPVMLCIWDPGLERFRFNQHLRGVLGWTEADIAAGDFLAKCYPDPAYRQWVADFMLSLEGGWRDMKTMAKDGTVVDTSWANIRLADGTSIGIGLDIRRRKAAEEALRESEERYRSLFETIHDGIVTVDMEGYIQHVNPAYQAMLGYTLDELRTLTYQQLTPACWHEAEAAIVRDRILARGDSGEYEKEYIRKDGSVFPVSLRTWPVRGANGRPRGLSAIVRDITERKRTEEALRRFAEKLQEADRRKDEFLATLAHELRNPLAPLRNALHVLQKSGGAGPSAERLRAMMARQVDHLVRLVDDLLEVSRITRGKVELRKEPAELRDILSHALETSQPLIKAGGHELAVSLPAEPLPLDADPVRLTQVFANLLNNAAKFTEAGGQIRVTAVRRNSEAVVRIRDTGIGIPAEMLPRVFDLFTQADRAVGLTQDGLGIGLALVRSLIELHGGRVEARSDGPGRGSEFIVRLPLAEAPSPAASLPESPSAGPRSPRRLLVVDDNEDAADSLALLLESLDIEVRVVYDGPSALEILAAFEPQVVLLDLGMPGMDGFEVARQIRHRRDLQDATLIALTGWGQEEDRRRTRQAGFDHHLVKPVDFEALQTLLASLEYC